MASSSNSLQNQQPSPALQDPIDEIAKGLALLPVRPCRGQKGFPVRLEANYFPLRLPSKFVVQRYSIEIVPPARDSSEKTSVSTATNITPPPKQPSKKASKAARKTILTGAISTGVPGAKTTLPIHSKAPGQAAIAKDAAAPSGPPPPDDSSAPDDSPVWPVPTGKKAEQIVKLFLDLPGLRPYRDAIFTDFRAILFSRQELPKGVLSLKVQYRTENNAVARPNALIYTVRLVKNARPLDLRALMEKGQGGDLTQLQFDRQELIQALNIFFLHYARSSPNRLSIGGRRSFPCQNAIPDRAQWDIGKGLWALRGAFSSVRVVDSNILVNVNLCHGAFYRAGSLVSLMENFNSARPTAELEAFLRGLRVGMTHYQDSNGTAVRPEQRVKMIVGLARRTDGMSANDNPPQGYQKPIVVRDFAGPQHVSFWYEVSGEQRWYTVLDYFRDKYHRTLNRNYPVINVGSAKKPVYVAAEVCEVIFGQLYQKKLDGIQTKAMTDGAANPNSATRKFIIDEGFKNVGLSDSNKQMKFFDIQAKPEMTKVKGRKLDDPTLQYGQNANQAVVPRNGEWNMANKQYREGKKLGNWSYLKLDVEGIPKPRLKRSPTVIGWGHVWEAMKSFYDTAKGNGLTFSTTFEEVSKVAGALTITGPDDHRLRGYLESSLEDFKVQLLVVMLPCKHIRLYQAIKRIADVELGLHTVCVVTQTFCNRSFSYYGNVALKINLKLGGINHELRDNALSVIKQTNTMVVGIDVTHPSPGSSGNCPSVAAMVASVDEKLGQWPAVLRLQRATQQVATGVKSQQTQLAPRQEIVSEIEEMLETRLDLWSSKNGKALPQNILVYRDGVSEGQYKAVIEQEIAAIQRRCGNIYKLRNQNRPRITFIVVAKRHHTRFFPPPDEQPRHIEGGVNPRNGTIVDNGVTDDRKWDFFLQSHTPLQGTARPAHYVVLRNDIFTPQQVKDYPSQYRNVADIVESVTYNLCWLYGRTTRAVSYCTPAYYADRACERARCYLSGYFDDGSSDGNAQRQARQGDVEVKSPLTDTMFYI